MNTPIWATEADIEAAGCGRPEIFDDERTMIDKLREAVPFLRKGKTVPNGVVLGVNPYTNDILMHDGPENILVMGPTRSGKGVNTIIPTSLLWQRSFFSFEQRSDLWEETASYRKNTLGQKVLKFSPLREDSAHWNPLGEIRINLTPQIAAVDIGVVANSIISCAGTGLPVIDSVHMRAVHFLAAIIAYLFAVFDYRGIPCMSDIIKLVSDKDTAKIVALLQSSYTVPDWCPKASIFLDDKVPSDDLMQIVKDALKPYCNSLVDQNTRSSDFRLAEFVDAKKPLSIYYCLDGQWQHRGIASLFINMLFYKFATTPNVGELQSKCLVMLDDAIELSYLPQIERAFVISASRGVRICLVVHDTKQLEGLFGRGNQIAQHCGVHVYFRTDPFCGESTLAAIPNLSVGKVITPEELLRLDLDKVIVFIEGHRPILAHKLRYYNNPCLKKICGEGEE